MDELEYLRKVCETQDKFIKGIIEKKELEQQLEMLRLRYIAYLKEVNNSLLVSIAHSMQTQKILGIIDKFDISLTEK